MGPTGRIVATLVSLGALALPAASLADERLERRLSNLMDRAGGRSGAWVYDAANRRRLFADAAGKRRIPASNQKLFTTAAILHRLGEDARLSTEVRAKGVLDGRVLSGDLYLVGDGDPALSSKSFARSRGLPRTPFGKLSRQVKDAGVRRVTGDVYADDSIFDRRRGVPDSGWATSPYIGPLAGLTYNSGLDGDGGFASDPALVAAKNLRSDLRRRGIRVGGKARLGEAPRRRRAEPLAAVGSPELETLVEETNHTSNNYFAEMLLKRLAAAGGKTGTTVRGARAVRRIARRMGAKIRPADGSGLTRSNRASPKAVGRLLTTMLRHRAASAFYDSLPVAGKEGTLASRMRGTAAEGRCRAKTGTLSDVSALSGYCRRRTGTVVFSILMNSVNPTSARALQDKMAHAIARYRP